MVLVNTFIEGRPATQGSKIRTRHGMRETSKYLAPWRDDVKRQVYSFCLQNNLEQPVYAQHVPVRLELEFITARPKYLGKNKQQPQTRQFDLDKLQRAVFDAITGVVVHDDRQITKVLATKRYARFGETTGVYLRAERDDSA